MSLDPLEALANQLSKTKMTGEGVSFVGKSLKLDNANDAKVVTDAIKESKNLEFLNLEGNTLGVEAAKAIGNALGSHSELKRALWKDMFTGRMKNEIPQALRYLGGGLEVAGARLVELDLSDNAFGPIGMEGLATLLRSPSCYTLQELLLNNNGLGIAGAKLLSKALMDCYDRSKSNGNPLPLRVFIAGRNRLENEGIAALSKVFKVLGSLEEIQIPQNGIYHKGIKELSEALKHNEGLRVLNLNDNIVTHKGCVALSTALPHLQLLRHINLGDCLLKSAGAIALAEGLQLKHLNLEELLLDHNEIKMDGGLAISQAMENKSKLKLLSLDGNQFGDDGVKLVKSQMAKYNLASALGSFEENESEDEDEEDSKQGNETDEASSIDNEDNSIDQNESSDIAMALLNLGSDLPESSERKILNLLRNLSTADFLKYPSPERFLALEGNKSERIIAEVKEGSSVGYFERILTAVMKVSSLCTQSSVSQEALECSNNLYRELFTWAQAQNCSLTKICDSLLVHIGLIKGEDKRWRPNYNLVACQVALKHAIQQSYFPQRCKDTIDLFLKKSQRSVESIMLS